MKEELKKSIESSASSVRSAKQKVDQADRFIQGNQAQIASLEKQIESLEELQPTLHEGRRKAIAEYVEAGQRYSFYCNEALNNPY